MNVNDLLSSPPVLDDPGFKKRPRAETLPGTQQQSLEVDIPTISELTTQFPTRSALHAHLNSLPRSMLIAMLLAENKDATGPVEKLAHCVYCHQPFDKSVEVQDCKVEHFGVQDGPAWDCCGLEILEYVDYCNEGYHAPPENIESPYCYEGIHRESLVSEEEAAAEADNGEVWWSEFGERGPDCKSMGCYDKVSRGHLDKKTKAG
ncbi:hypothetical protein DFP73DRAFT_545859 [Morchella snyderi]|nr:hypothetical protein DFP73DRAFT_545859 [Morchella snyderi]